MRASMSIPVAPMAQIITCRNGFTFTDVKQKHHQAMEHKLDLVRSDGTNGVLILWSGENAFKATMAAGSFQDRQRILQRRIDTDRQFDIVSAPTRATFEASGKLVSDAQAVLVVTGLCTGPSPTEFYNEALSEEGAAAAMAKPTEHIPGAICNIFLQGSQGREAKLMGDVLLFADEQSMEDYVASELWAKARAEASWQDVKVERYVIASTATAAAA